MSLFAKLNKNQLYKALNVKYLPLQLAITSLFCLFISQSLAIEVAPKPDNQNSIAITADKIDTSRFYNIAVVQGLNKTTAKTSILEMKIDERIRFGQLTIVAHRCWQSSLDQKPESKILLEVFENKGGEKADEEAREKRIFYGWMFASSPSISGLEHPIYDLIALKCKNK